MTPFKVKMKTLLLILLMALPQISLADQLQINCSNGQCSSSDLSSAHGSCSSIVNKTQCEAKVLGSLCSWVDDANPNGGYCTGLPASKVCSGFDCVVGQTMSVMKFRGLLNKDVNILTNSTGSPQNIGLSFNGGAYPGVNANIALGAQNQSANAANIIVIADNVNNFNINLDGYSGKQGKSAAEICAQRIKDGVYGTDLQTYFNNRRATTAADPNRCDADDLNYMQTFNFTCDDPAFTEVPSNDPTVQVSQIKKLARCSAVASYNYCVKRKVNVTCNFRLWSSYRQSWFNTQDLAKNSYVSGPSNCYDQYVSCGNVNYNCSCSFGSNCSPSYISPVTSSSSSSFSYSQCVYRGNGTGICSGGSGGQVEAFYKTNNCVSQLSPTMSMEKTLQILNVDEDFYNQEVSRLGTIGKFCDRYAAIPGKSNQDWWGGVPGAPPNATGTVAGQPGKEINGIPWEFMAAYTTSKLVASTEPAGASVNWKTDTSSNGGYSPIVTNDGTNWITKSAYWKGYGTSTGSFTTPGLNPDGLTLAPGSQWQVMQTNTFEACPTGWTVLKNVFMNLVQYTNKENTSCSGVSDPQDPNNRAFWQYTGITQEPTFGTEFVSCNIGSCAVGSTVSELSRSLDTIAPGNGENGTEQGRGLVFVYDIKNPATEAVAGGSGATGIADISVNPQTRICVKIDDANAGINTSQAKNPFVSFRRYNWQVLKSTAGGNPGTPPRNTGKAIEIYKKIDPSARYLLDKSLL